MNNDLISRYELLAKLKEWYVREKYPAVYNELVENLADYPDSRGWWNEL